MALATEAVQVGLRIRRITIVSMVVEVVIYSVDSVKGLLYLFIMEKFNISFRRLV